eukprot:121655-Ditylum_brightwellii.AAC.1
MPPSDSFSSEYGLSKEEIPQFKLQQLELGEFIGKGKFSEVHEVIKINKKRRQRQRTANEDANIFQESDTEDFSGQFCVKMIRREC